MSKPTTTKTNKKTNNAPVQDETSVIFFEMLEHLSECGRATRDLAESVDAWKVTTLVFSIVSIIALITSILK